MLSLGIDIGSVAVKIALIDEGKIVRSFYRRFEAGPFETLHSLLSAELADLNGKRIELASTGIGGKTIQSVLGGISVGEIAALAEGNYELLPNIRTVIEMGGEDSKLLILDSSSQSIVDFAMNAQCAAGTGSFLDQQAARLGISIEDEFGKLALKSKKPPRIAGRCSVFAKSDMIHLQQIATPDYDIVAGLCFAVARNFKSSIARGKRFDRPIAFEGGVAANPGMVRAFSEILGLSEGELIIPKLHNVVLAVGAARMAHSKGAVVESFSPGAIEFYLKNRTAPDSGRSKLVFDFPDSKHYDTTLAKRPLFDKGHRTYLGIDIGSLSTNLVLIDDKSRVIARRYLMTEGRPIEAVRKGLKEIGEEAGSIVEVAAVGTTGSGRYLIGDFVGADIVRNEITAQATAAVENDPTVDTIFEIGGQDSKYISLDNGTVIDFEMNKACAAGTGSFIQEQAEKLNINIKLEFGEKALQAECPVGCGERCTVFMESDLVSHQRSGVPKDDLVAGLAYSIASNYLNKVVGDRRIGKNILFQGGVAWNKGVVAAFENITGHSITVPPHHDVTGAIGAAILARETAQETADFSSKFQGFDLHERKYEISTFDCEDCSNDCEINKVEIEGLEALFYGARCEKYETNSSKDQPLPTDTSSIRRKLLLKKRDADSSGKIDRGMIGLPRVLHFYEFYPFWSSFLRSLGFKVVTSGVSSQKIVESSLELFPAETCFPIKLVYGHIAELLERKVKRIFFPSIIRVAEKEEELGQGGYICPYVQTIGATVKAKFDFDSEGVQLISPTFSMTDDSDALLQQLRPLQKELGVSDRELKRAVHAGHNAYRGFREDIRSEGEKILNDVGVDEKVLVLISRPYNGNDQRLSLDLADKIRKLGVKAIPMDFLTLDDDPSPTHDMYWRYGKRILSTASHIRNNKNLFAVYLTSFGCGPDSFITHFFRRTMTGKPYLQLELDEHSADAGMVTRIEAFVDSLRHYEFKPPIETFTVSSDSYKPFERTIYIPNMCDHAYAMRASMERFGLRAKVLDESDDLTLEYGKKFTTGKECFPCVVTTGDLIKKVRETDFDPGKSVFLMPGATGPCRFGQYSHFHRLILDDLGFKDVPILSPNSKDGYTEFGLDGTAFRPTVWKGFVFVDCLQRITHQIRPYEKNQGETDRLYREYLGHMDQAIIYDKPITSLAEKASRAFAAIEVDPIKKPMVGVVGEIFLRTNQFSNNHLIDKLEALGLEVWLAPFSEWPLYTSFTYRRDSWKDRKLKNLLESQLQIAIQQRQEHSIVKAFTTHYPFREDHSVGSVLKLAKPYLSVDCKGEAILSIGKSLEMSQRGASGIVNAMPFNCMPGTIVSSLSRKVSGDAGGIPWLNISYEGLRDSGEATRLEAFAEQVRAFEGNGRSLPISLQVAEPFAV